MAATMKFERVSDTEMTMERAFQAPRELVWRAYTEPEMLAQWWGPRTFQTEIKEMDVRPGGVWHYCMRSKEWGDAWGRAIYREVVAPERLAYTDAFSDEQGSMIPPESEMTMDFEQDGTQTVVRSRVAYKSSADLDKVVEMGVEEGTRETLDRLDEFLQAQQQ